MKFFSARPKGKMFLFFPIFLNQITFIKDEFPCNSDSKSCKMKKHFIESEYKKKNTKNENNFDTFID